MLYLMLSYEIYICLKCTIDTWAFHENPDTCRGMYLVIIVN